MVTAKDNFGNRMKYLMEDIEIAKGIISRIIQEEIEVLQFSAREEVIPRDHSEISLFRLDFVAQIRTADNRHRKVLIEIQKAKLSSDISRFRTCLGKQYIRQEEVAAGQGQSRKTSLPIISIYILGFNLSDTLPAAIKVKR